MFQTWLNIVVKLYSEFFPVFVYAKLDRIPLSYKECEHYCKNNNRKEGQDWFGQQRKKLWYESFLQIGYLFLHLLYLITL